MTDGAWRTISVALELTHQRYTAGADAAMAATRRMGSSIDGLVARADGLDHLAARYDRLDQLGGKLTRSVTLPALALGAASVKMASDYDTAFTRMTTLAGAPAEEIDRLKESVKGLAKETGRSPTELAEGLYQIESSGVDASKALGVLDAASKASALGMGETADIANAVTSVMNTYGEGTITAAQATDILAGAVKAGKGEAAAMAPQLGNLLPLAKQLGIDFTETAGTLAFLTQTNGDAARSSTMLEGVMQKLIKPTRQGREELEAVGLTVEKVRDVIAKDGLAAGIDLVGRAFEGNQEGLSRFFDDAQGLVGVFQLLDEGGARWKDTLGEVAKSQGLVSTGMQTLQATDEFKLNQAIAELKVSLVDLGQELIPVAADMAHAIATLAGAFAQLPGPAQTTLLALVGISAAAGPVIRGVSLVGKGIDVVTSSADDGAGALGRFGAAHGPAGVQIARFVGVLGTAAAGLEAYGLTYQFLEDRAAFDGDQTKLVKVLEQVGTTADNTVPLLENYGFSLDDLASSIALDAAIDGSSNVQRLGAAMAGQSGEIASARNEMGAYDEAIASIADRDPQTAIGAYRQLAAALMEGGLSAKDVAHAFPQANDAISEYRGSLVLGASEAGRATDAEQLFQEAIDGTAGAADDSTDAIRERTDAVDASWQANLRAISTGDALATAEERLSQAERAYAGDSDAAREAAQRITDARADAAKQDQDSARQIADAERSLADTVEQATDDRAAAAERLAAARRAAEGDSDNIRDKEERLADAIEATGDKQQRVIDLTEELAAARKTAAEQLEDLQRREKDDALSVEEASIAVEEARRAVAEHNAGEDDLDRRREAVRLERAREALAEAQRRQQENAQELADRQSAGINGSQIVLDATEALTSARGDEVDALSAQRDAEGDLAQAHQDAADELVAATENMARVEEESRDRIQQAQQAMADARQNAADRAASAAKQVADAEANSAAIQGQANKDLEQAKRDVIQARLDDIESQGDAIEAAGDTNGAIESMITRYSWLRMTLENGSPLAQAMDARIEALREIQRLAASAPGAQAVVPPSGAPGAWNAERHLSGGAKSLTPHGAIADLASLTVGTLIVPEPAATKLGKAVARGGGSEWAIHKPTLTSPVTQPVPSLFPAPADPAGIFAGARMQIPGQPVADAPTIDTRRLAAEIAAALPPTAQFGPTTISGVLDPEAAGAAAATFLAQRLRTVM